MAPNQDKAGGRMDRNEEAARLERALRRYVASHYAHLQHQDRLDLTQDVVTLILEKFPEREELAQLLPMARVMADLQLRSRRTTFARRRELLHAFAELAIAKLENPAAEAVSLLRDEVRVAIYKAMAEELTPRERYLVLARIKGASIRSIAAELDVSKSKAYTTFSSAMDKLQRRLADYRSVLKELELISKLPGA